MATAAVGKLWVGLDLKTGGYQTGLKKSESMTKTTSVKIKGIWKSAFAGQFLANLATKAFASVTRVISSAIGKIKKAFEDLDELAKLSTQLQISVNWLKVFRREAGKSGAGAENFNSGIEKLAINLGKAATDGGPVADTLERMGLNAKELAKIPLDQAFLKIADAVSKQGNAITRAADTAVLFGKVGPKVALMMAGGADRLRESFRESAKLGLIVSADQLGSIEAANDAMADTGLQVDSLFEKISIALGPHMQRFAEAFSDAFTSAEGSTKSIIFAVDTVAAGFHLAVGLLQISAGKIGVLFTGIAKLLVDMLAGINKILASLPGGAPIDQQTMKNIKSATDAAFGSAKDIFVSGSKRIADVISGAYQDRIDLERRNAKALFDEKQREAEKARQAAGITGMADNEERRIGISGPDIIGPIKNFMQDIRNANAKIFGNVIAEQKTTPPLPTAATALIEGSAEAQAAINANMIGAKKIDEKIEENTGVIADATAEIVVGIAALLGVETVRI